jgi:hypothetical protein
MRDEHTMCLISALLAVEAIGGERRFFSSDPAFLDAVSTWSPSCKRSLVLDMKEAWALGAYVVEQPFLDTETKRNPDGTRADVDLHGWRLCQYSAGTNGGERDVGPIFHAAEAFQDAMRVIRDMGER